MTTTADSGAGSLRDGILGKGKEQPRTIVFGVGGTIQLKKELRIENVADLTLAGQTAPGEGITLRDHGIRFAKCSNIIVRCLRFRLGDSTKTSEDVIGLGSESGPCRNIIFDHVTATWGIDAIMDTDQLSDFTMQWCLFGEALNDSTHYKKAPHAMLMSFRRTRGNIRIHHNLLFSSRDRHPTLGGGEPQRSNAEAVFDFRNNVIYNWEGPCNLASGRFNLVGNYWRPGPNTRPWEQERPIAPKAEAQDVTRGVIRDNVFEDHAAWTADNLSAVAWGARGGKYVGDVTREAFALAGEPVAEADRPVTHTAADAYAMVLNHAGASRLRDAADARVIAGVRDRSNRRIDSQRDVGGWPVLKTAPAPRDTDHDGMPDEWERRQRLDPRDPIDRNDRRPDGSTNLEQYLNSLIDMPRLGH